MLYHETAYCVTPENLVCMYVCVYLSKVEGALVALMMLRITIRTTNICAAFIRLCVCVCVHEMKRENRQIRVCLGYS